MMNNRTVITGMGVVTPLGNTIDEYWSALLDGRCGIGPITRFDVTEYPTRIAAEVKNFDPSSVIEKKEARRLDLTEQFAVCATDSALRDAGLDAAALATIDLDRCGVVIGSGIGGVGTFEEQHSKLVTSGPGRVSPFFIPMMIIDMCAGIVSIRYGFRGPNYGTVSACSSSAHAIADAYRIIQRGEADIMITGGAEAAITPVSLAGFCQAKAMSTRNDAPEKSSRPFDKDRDGFIMGEGSAILILESYEYAVKRGARIYAEVLGAGMTGDAHHITAPHPDGNGARRAMASAIKDAGLTPDRIDYINTHGTATDLGDIAETRAIKGVLGDRAYKVPCNSTKSMLGHLLGAAGAVELIASVKSIEQQIVHPTINLETPDPDCDLDYVAGDKRSCQVRYAMSNSFGFGGHNVSLVVGHLNGDQ
jgi:3-oxoacyl-[acyl-carrier-protein] synthase II